jgi:hypothetical protein
MTTDPEDPLEFARRELDLLREAIAGGEHWIYVTDSPVAARTLRLSAAGALFAAQIAYIPGYGDEFFVAIMAVRKKAWPPSAALRVAEAACAAAGGKGPPPGSVSVREGSGRFILAIDSDRLNAVVRQVCDGRLRPRWADGKD